ncbi:DUF262 domain-containing protein [Eggerthella sinensis]|uniref:DUF262 domain-containing protein n=1 Tax=Eggerthella sinensis TaxID=242230 RepID=UPI0022E3FDDA|nr:DUF262 domain-containing protein [Eggerthella sinensis]
MKSNQEIREQLHEQRRKVDFDAYDISCEELVTRIEKKRIDVAPVYQRQFRWDDDRQSALIESLLLGIPVPNLFMATNNSPDQPLQWEIVDGLQRSLTIMNFIAPNESRELVGLTGKSLRLKGMSKLANLNDLSYADLPNDIATLLLDRPLKVTVLNDKSDKQVRFDLFERLNTGGISLTDQEVRECIFRGKFLDMLSDLSHEEDFTTTVRLTKSQKSDGTQQEYVLRFFAFLDCYENFDHSVKDFLNEYTEWADKEVGDREEYRKVFRETFQYLSKCFPEGIVRNRKTTPINFYEGIAVGAALALKERVELPVAQNLNWILSEEYKKATTGATNSRAQVKRRIEYARDNFLMA